MKTLQIDLNKLSREGLRAFLTLSEEVEPEVRDDEEGVDLPFPDGYDDLPQQLPDAPKYPTPPPPKQPEYPIPEEPKDEETSFSV